ncbi:MAG TPA: hypothetical protein VNO79_09065 [Actinomycetota bacterium]|nr:hypothetical protein [Actinomycetota bacterium]
MNRDRDLRADWETSRREKLTAGLALTPAERLAWLEEAIAFAHRAGALPRRTRGDRGPEEASDPAARRAGPLRPDR